MNCDLLVASSHLQLPQDAFRILLCYGTNWKCFVYKISLRLKQASTSSFASISFQASAESLSNHSRNLKPNFKKLHIFSFLPPQNKSSTMAKVMARPLPLPAESIVKKNVEYWEDRYKTRHFEWHIDDVHPQLVKYMHLLTNHHISGLDVPTDTGLKWFVPLCGKTKDIPFLLDQGHEVFGVECVHSVVQELFDENNIEVDYDADKLLYTSKDGKMKMYCGDLFKCPIEEFGPFDVVWDRASLIALEYQFRPAYIEMMKRGLKGAKDYRYLLQCVVYDRTKYPGPPRSMDADEVEQLFGPWADVTLLESAWGSFDHSCRKVSGNCDKKFREEFHLIMPK